MNKIIYRKSAMLTDAPLTYCPGCAHGIIHKLTAEALEEFGPRPVIGVASVGCSVFAYNFFNCDMQQAAHGRACAVATGIKRARPEACLHTRATGTFNGPRRRSTPPTAARISPSSSITRFTG